ncbi:AAA family ATPase [Endozoicomonas sp.]|uniref:AAA family ATPase n=1 Tax=Endozoicomonas sp. TaxID=1892382 RepID=UPI003AF5F57D
MQSRNFQPLAASWPELYEHACFAEQYAYTDPHTSIVKLRCFAEVLVGNLYRDLELRCEEGDSFFEKLKSEAFQKLVDRSILSKFHAIRILGNKAAHGNSVTSDDALALVREAYLIGKWLYKTYSFDISGDYPEFADPAHADDDYQKLSTANNFLAEQLNAAKAELQRLEASEKAAQQHAESLKQVLDNSRHVTFKNASTQAANSFDLESDNTRQLISIHDAFSQYTLNTGQAELVNKLDHFLSSKEDKVFLLKGYAGTGKTFITKGLTEYFRAIGRNYVLAAPTGKASKVIANKTQSPAYTLHKTIYCFKDIKEYREDDLEGSETYKLYAQLAVNEMSADTVFIIDEASMVSDVYSENEFFRCGSGHLLRDFLKYVNLDHNDHQKKVIFIGDDAQLPPVGMNFSPALDNGYLFREHNVRSTAFELREVVRQKSDSGVMRNSIQLRESLGSGSFGQLVVDLNYPDLHKVEHNDLLSQYLKSCQGKINGESIVIAHSNSDVAAYNKHIREHFFPHCPEITSGDKVMAVSNSNTYGFFISNGDFGLVKSVSDTIEQRVITLKRKNQETGKTEEVNVPLRFRRIDVGFKDLDGTSHFFNAMIFEDLLYSEHPGLSSDQSKAMYVDFCIRNRYLERGSLAFKEALKSDPYFNALRLKFGYAITCHKAQGSEWNHVFVKCKTHQSQLSADYFRWLYTAITRTADKLYLLDPPDFKTGSTMSRVFNSGIELLAGNKQPAPSAEINTYPTGKESISQFGIPDSAAFLLTILERVKSLIAGHAIEIDDIIHNQYQEAYVFKRKNNFARINITYSGKNKVTNVVDAQTTELGSYVADLLASLKNSALPVKTAIQLPSFQFEKAFLNDFHQRLSLLTGDHGISIQDVTSHQWSQRYTFVRDSEVAIFDIYYNGKDRFTKPVPVIPACTPGSLVIDVEMLLIEGMSA